MLSDFLMMNGYGAFVWSAYGIMFIGIMGLVLSLLWRQRMLLKEMARLQAKLDEPELAPLSPDSNPSPNSYPIHENGNRANQDKQSPAQPHNR